MHISLRTVLLSVFVISAGACHGSGTTGKLLICYYTPTSYFPASQVPADLCTHIIYAFGKINASGIEPRSPGDLQKYTILMQLKKKNPQLKILLSLQSGFPLIVGADPAKLTRFSQSSVQFLNLHGFDGVDLDWEFPKASDKDNYRKFIEILHTYIAKAKMQLSAALPNNPVAFKGYDVNCLSRNMDFMTAMTYDFHAFSKGDNITGYNSPLYTPPGERQFLSTSAMLTYYLKIGIPPGKLAMGIPLYGRSWVLAKASQHSLHSPAVSSGTPSPYRHLRGIYVYPDVCVAKQNGASEVLDKENGAAYLYINTTWVAYEAKSTIPLKLAWMKSANLAGVGVWAMHLDDNTGVCKDGLFPLLTTIKSNI